MEEQCCLSDYERTRERTIKENLERMRMLGILEVSLQLKSSRKPFRKLKAPHFKTISVPAPLRRSPRLQNTDPVMYPEVTVDRNHNSSKSFNNNYLGLNSKPDLLSTEEVLCESSMSVNGYQQDGKRIYDSVRGKTCHQCRQKTLGHRTTCSKCNLLRGQFCEDCLSKRYGEQFSEANQNPDWICPPCRGICNCSLCRRANGLAPTGLLYRKIASLGYKSVADYLSQTVTPVRRPLPYSGAPSTDTDSAEGLVQHFEKGIQRNQCNAEEKNDGYGDMDIQDGNEMTARKDNLATGQMVASENSQMSADMPVGENGHSIKRPEITENKLEVKLESFLQVNDLTTKESKLNLCNKRPEICHLVVNEMLSQEIINVNTPVKMSKRKRGGGVRIGPSSDSIAGRIKLRRSRM